MTQTYIIALGKQIIWIILLISAPMLLSGLLVGLLISILQAVTQIHEMTITFIPKIIAVLIALVIFLPWISNILIDFTINLFSNIPNIIH